MLKKGTRPEPYTCTRGLNEWRRDEGEEEEGLPHGGFITVMYHYVRLTPLTSCPLPPYISRVILYLYARRNS